MVDIGELMLEPDAAAKAVKACRELQEKLSDQITVAESLARKVDFGQCNEGNALSEKFFLKAKGTPTSLWEVLTKAYAILDNMAETYLAAGKAYADQESRNVDTFTQR